MSTCKAKAQASLSYNYSNLYLKSVERTENLSNDNCTSGNKLAAPFGKTSI